MTEHLSGLIETAERDRNVETDVENTAIWDRLDDQHYKLWSEALKNHKRRTQELAKYQKESLATSHNARILLLNEQLNQVTNEKILKMRRSQIDAAEADYARRIQGLDIAMERADITAGPVAYGSIQVEESTT